MSAVKTESYAAHEDCGDGFSKHWQVCRLKDKAAFNPSKTEIKELPRECTFAPMEKLKKDSLLTDVTTITSDISGSYTYFREGDILVAKVTPCFENRNIAIAKNLTRDEALQRLGEGSQVRKVRRCTDPCGVFQQPG